MNRSGRCEVSYNELVEFVSKIVEEVDYDIWKDIASGESEDSFESLADSIWAKMGI